MTDDTPVTAYREDEARLAEAFMREAREALIGLARSRRRRAGFSDTMMTEDILHECFARLTGRTVWQSQEHFLRCAALAIRHVVVDHARSRLTARRGHGAASIPLEDAEGLMPEFSETPEQIVIIGDLLRRLEQENPRWLRIVDARYFAGMTEAETAALLGLSERTVRRDWTEARVWLAERMGVGT